MRPVEPGKAESYIGFFILLVLFVIAGGILMKQSRYDAGMFAVVLSKDASPSKTSDSAGSTRNLQNYLPPGMVVLSPVETFGPESLSEKIDGKAELYLSAGFLSLSCQRFAEEGRPDIWLEIFVYDMGSMRNAFSVFSTQRRANAQDADFTRFAYRTTNALFFLKGQYYVEVVAASDQVAEAIIAIGQNFVRDNPSSTDSDEVDEASLFPNASLVPGSVSLLAENAFGFSSLDSIFIAHYTVSDSELTAFLSRRQTTQEAKDLALAYHEFLLENGGVDVAANLAIPEARLVKIFETFELIFVQRNFLAGVHEAENRDLAEQLALDLNSALTGVRR
jgi:hypothetical protein